MRWTFPNLSTKTVGRNSVQYAMAFDMMTSWGQKKGRNSASISPVEDGGK